jgi:hypothetical protein
MSTILNTSQKTSSRLGGASHYSIHATHRLATPGSNVPLMVLEVRDDTKAGRLCFDENTEAGRRRLRAAIRAMPLAEGDMKHLCDLVQEARLRAAL